MKLIDPADYSLEDLTKLTWLRATEWASWPAFVSQPILPVLYVFFPVWTIYLSILLVGLLWRTVRYRLANLELAAAAVYWVKLKWITIPLSAIYLFVHHHWVLALLCLGTPLIVGFLGVTAAGAQIGVLQRQFFSQMGFDDPNTRAVYEAIDKTRRAFQ
jgi:hypothetical protein